MTLEHSIKSNALYRVLCMRLEVNGANTIATILLFLDNFIKDNPDHPAIKEIKSDLLKVAKQED